MTESDVRVLQDVSAARALLDDEQRRYLFPFLGADRSAGEVAAELGESVERTAYRVRGLAARGLLTVSGERKRTGRPVLIYHAPAEFQAPIASLPMADMTRLFDLIDRSGREAFLTSLSRLAVQAGLFDWSVRFYADNGAQRLELHSPTLGDQSMQHEAAPAIVFNWVPLAVDDVAAKRLQRTLQDLIADLPPARGAPTHLLGVFLSPLGR